MSKKFVSDKMISQGALSEPAYRMVWHSLGSKEYSSTFLERLKETEARVLKQAKEKAKENALHIEKEAYEKGFEACSVEKNCEFCNEWIHGL